MLRLPRGGGERRLALAAVFEQAVSVKTTLQHHLARPAHFVAAIAVAIAALSFGPGPSDGAEKTATCGSIPITKPAGLCKGRAKLRAGLPVSMKKDPASVSRKVGQRLVDCFAWQTFAALSYPSSDLCRGEPAPNGKLEWSSDRVWETYKEPYELFQATDTDWNPAGLSFNDEAPAGACGTIGSGKKILRHSAKFPFMFEDAQAFLPGIVLTDQRGNTVWYEVLMNRDVFEYIRDSGLARTGAYSFGGPLDTHDKVDFPVPSAGMLRAGTTEIKAAWRIMTSQDDTSRYFTQDAVIYDGTDCEEETVGLVGLHISRKIAMSPKWIWATFEHVDNVPDAGTDGDGRDYNFFSDYCAANEPENCDAQVAITDTAYLCCPNLIPYPSPDPEFSINQVTRLTPIDGNAKIGRRYKRAFARSGSPFRHFRLVGAQWAKPRVGGKRKPDIADELSAVLGAKASAPDQSVAQLASFHSAAWDRPCNPNGPWGVKEPKTGQACYEQIPATLRNTSMETLIVQTDKNGTQYSADSCMNCHFAGGVDGSYLWLDAMLNPYEISDN
jgi:hypothetical protein